MAPKSRGRRPTGRPGQRRPVARPASGQPSGQPSGGLVRGRTGPSTPPAPHTPGYEALPPPGASYPQILRGETYVWWRSLLGVVLGLSLFLLMTSVISQAVVFISWALTSADRAFAPYATAALNFELPVGMLATNLGIATLIPISWLLMALVHQVKPRWLSSVGPRLRWRYLLLSLAVATVALNAVLLLSTLAGPPMHLGPQPGFWGFLVVIILTSPLQAAAEEYFFRGYLMQAFGSLVANPWFGVVMSSVVFALLHGAQNLPLFADRLAFGLLAAVLVLKTGGLEAGIAAHVINNVFAFTIAGLTTSIAAVKQITTISWADAAFDVGGFALFALLAYLLAVRMRMRTQVQGAV
ncbi:hypothetical protein GCM10009841_19510 [Microlunatus panaciterrae]|uniref:Membrane protease YdiL (CAAX protease family) n=1 Tax=Microlunatus panaciterrae TaxID=400768 RepID=A0ABS2RRD7_9ACTN|nr:type II CAAX endopeptidase family protein [Microlunatus panaciterrae]MBM7800509.1 membrane protease YdiL (CAAX protease family) [Microlunatus panaciterrae]